MEPRCNSGSKERDKLPESFVQFSRRNTKQMDYVKEVQEWDKQTKRRGWWVRRVLSEDVNTEERARATARIELKNGRTTKRRGERRTEWGRAGEMDESCWGLKGASERVNLK